MRHTFPARWKARKLDQLGSVGRGRSRHRPRNEPLLYGGEYPFFQTGDVKAANLYLSEYSQTYNEKGLAQSKQWEPGTLCITIAANIADTAILGIRGCFPDSVIGFIANPTQADVCYIKYYIDLIKLDMQQVSHGTTQDNLSLDKLLSFDFVVPSVEDQRKITSILSAYDDLIENNLRRIKILEEMAQNLYHEWFVKFRFPGHQHAHFTDSSLGRIPEGWEIVKVQEILKKVRRNEKIQRKDYATEGLIPIIDQGKEFIGGYTDDSKSIISEDLPLIVFGDHTRILKFIDFPFACGAEGTQLLKSKDERMPMTLFFHTLSSIELSDFAYARHFKFLKEKVVVLPEKTIADYFNKNVAPMRDQIRSMMQRNTLLRRTRDLLLPKLISGEVDVSELDITVPEEAER